MFGFWKSDKDHQGYADPRGDGHGYDYAKKTPPPFEINRKMLRVYMEGEPSITCKNLDEVFDEVEKWANDFDIKVTHAPIRIEIVSVNETFRMNVGK